MRFNEQLKETRKNRGYTQKDICTMLKVSPNCYASWEQGRTEPDIESIKKLCMIFEISADELLGLEYPDGTKVYAKNYIHNVNNHGNITIK